MATEQREREDKYDVGLGFQLPAVDSFVPTGGRVESVELNLESVYYDTDRKDLLSNKLTLRCRSGDSDTGWQLKVPDGAARTEIRLAATAGSSVPKELRDLTRGVRRDRPLAPIAVLRTVRSATRVLDENDAVVVEIADDRVVATVTGSAAVVSEWREIEVELGNGDEAVLARVGRRLQRAGAVPAASTSKIGRALDVPAVTPPLPPASAGGVVLAYFRQQYDAIITGDLATRRGQNAIHPTRVATRRMRSALRVFGDLFDPDRAAALDEEVGWYGQSLGAVRDQDVQRARFADTIAELPAELVLGPVAAHIDEHLAAEQSRHERALARALNGKRYLAMLDELAGWLESPPCTAAAEKPAKTLDRAVHRIERKAATRLRDALATGDDVLLHRARKAAKRARYALEATEDVPSVSKAKQRIKHYKKLQGTLGEHQDSVTAAELLRRFGAKAGTTAGETGFTYGLLYARELDRARESRDAATRWRV
jgi:CHAD domain-containing protein